MSTRTAPWPYRYATARPHRIGARQRVSHLVAQQMDWLPHAYFTACGHFLRGESSDAPVARVCEPCAETAAASDWTPPTGLARYGRVAR